jgi:hypothetical protein
MNGFRYAAFGGYSTRELFRYAALGGYSTSELATGPRLSA